MPQLYHTPYCWDCINAAIASCEEILEVLSDPRNHEEQRQRLIRLIREREEMREEHARIGLTDPPPARPKHETKTDQH
jgi:hypothetical protein